MKALDYTAKNIFINRLSNWVWSGRDEELHSNSL